MEQAEARSVRRELLARIKRKVIKRALGACWLWTGQLQGAGYPVLRHGGRRQSARRLSYEAHGILPAARNRALWAECGRADCVNPKHLKVNSRRKGGRKGNHA